MLYVLLESAEWKYIWVEIGLDWRVADTSRNSESDTEVEHKVARSKKTVSGP